MNTVAVDVLRWQILASNLTYSEVTSFGGACRLFYAATRGTRERLQHGANLFARIHTELERRIQACANAVIRIHHAVSPAEARLFITKRQFPGAFGSSVISPNRDLLFLMSAGASEPDEPDPIARMQAINLSTETLYEIGGVSGVYKLFHWLREVCADRKNTLLQFFTDAPMAQNGHRQPPVFSEAMETHEFLAEADNPFWNLVVGNVRATELLLTGCLSTIMLRTDIPHDDVSYRSWPRESVRLLRSSSSWFNLQGTSHRMDRKELSYRYRFLEALLNSEHGCDAASDSRIRCALPLAETGVPLRFPTRIWRVLFDLPWSNCEVFLCNMDLVEIQFGLAQMDEAEYARETSLYDAQVIATPAEHYTIEELILQRTL